MTSQATNDLPVEWQVQFPEELVGQEILLAQLPVLRDERAIIAVKPNSCGVTSLAHILAREASCQNYAAQKRACLTCENCVTFKDRPDSFVIVIDCASPAVRKLEDTLSWFPSKTGAHKPVLLLENAQALSERYWQKIEAYLAASANQTYFPGIVMIVIPPKKLESLSSGIFSMTKVVSFNQLRGDQIVEVLRRNAEFSAIDLPVETAEMLAAFSEGNVRHAFMQLHRLLVSGKALSPAVAAENLGFPQEEIIMELFAALNGDSARSEILVASVFEHWECHMIRAGLLLCYDTLFALQNRSRFERFIRTEIEIGYKTLAKMIHPMILPAFGELLYSPKFRESGNSKQMTNMLLSLRRTLVKLRTQFIVPDELESQIIRALRKRS